MSSACAALVVAARMRHTAALLGVQLCLRVMAESKIGPSHRAQALAEILVAESRHQCKNWPLIERLLGDLEAELDIETGYNL